MPSSLQLRIFVLTHFRRMNYIAVFVGAENFQHLVTRSNDGRLYANELSNLGIVLPFALHNNDNPNSSATQKIVSYFDTTVYFACWCRALNSRTLEENKATGANWFCFYVEGNLRSHECRVQHMQSTKPVVPPGGCLWPTIIRIGALAKLLSAFQLMQRINILINVNML